jgi:hypothetical protein
MVFAGCWSCGAHGPCYTNCDCAKCVDPEGYADWRADDPEGYADWIDRQHVEECDCPSCLR